MSFVLVSFFTGDQKSVILTSEDWGPRSWMGESDMFCLTSNWFFLHCCFPVAASLWCCQSFRAVFMSLSRFSRTFESFPRRKHLDCSRTFFHRDSFMGLIFWNNLVVSSGGRYLAPVNYLLFIGSRFSRPFQMLPEKLLHWHKKPWFFSICTQLCFKPRGYLNLKENRGKLLVLHSAVVAVDVQTKEFWLLVLPLKTWG